MRLKPQKNHQKKGNTEFEIPDLVGKTLDEAKLILEGSKLGVSSVLYDSEESILYEKSIPIRYSDTLNKFIEFKLTPNVIITDTFYVG